MTVCYGSKIANSKLSILSSRGCAADWIWGELDVPVSMQEMAQTCLFSRTPRSRRCWMASRSLQLVRPGASWHLSLWWWWWWWWRRQKVWMWFLCEAWTTSPRLLVHGTHCRDLAFLMGLPLIYMSQIKATEKRVVVVVPKSGWYHESI